MKIVKTIMQPIEEIKSIKCNKCGKIIPDIMYDDYLSVNRQWGYFSNIFKDEENHKFDLCEECYAEIISSFKIAPEGFGYSAYSFDKVIEEISEQELFEEWKKNYTKEVR
jgi:hypothetical protein